MNLWHLRRLKWWIFARTRVCLCRCNGFWMFASQIGHKDWSTGLWTNMGLDNHCHDNRIYPKSYIGFSRKNQKVTLRGLSNEDVLRLYNDYLIVLLGCRKKGLEIKLQELSVRIIRREASTTMFRSGDHTLRS